MAKSRPPRARGRKKGRALTVRAPADPVLTPQMAPSQVLAARQLFWHNVIREILTSLSTLCSLRSDKDGAADGQTDELVQEAKADEAASGAPAYDPALFDGRLAVITKAGERVAIADVFPLFACGINSARDRGLSLALECTVFQVRTPDGHVYTLPLHEIRAFHALTPELMRRLERIARRKRATAGPGDDEEQTPFGFAAFTSLMGGPPRPIEPAPNYPTE
jgi:hypothetical protein